MSENNNQKFIEFLKKILRKLKPRFSFHYVAYTTLFLLVIFSTIKFVGAAVPNPGHDWDELGDGVFVFTNSQTTTPYTYTFPAANSTVLTTNATVTIAQGGTGQTSIPAGSVWGANSANTLSAITSTSGTRILTNTSGTITWELPASGMTWPAGGAGIPNYSGSSSWGTSYTTTGSGTVVALATSPSFTTPSLGVATATSVDYGGTTLLASRALTVDTGGIFNIDIGSASGDDFTVDTNKLVVEGDTGNVGIGTASPQYHLDVRGGSSGGSALYVEANNQTNGSGSTLSFTGASSEGVLAIKNLNATAGYDTGINLISADTTTARKYSIMVDYSDSSKLKINTDSTSTLSNLSTSNLFTLTTTGNVGVGTANPTYGLEVATNGTNGYLKAGPFSINTSGVFITSSNIIYTGSNSGGFYSSSYHPYPNGSNLTFYDYTTNPLLSIVTADGATKGNVGIGTTAPAYQLHLSRNADNQLYFNNPTGSVGSTAGILLGTTSNDSYIKGGIFFERMDGAAQGSLHFATGNSGGAEVVSKSNARMTIDMAGNVGIGTTTPSGLLHLSSTNPFVSFTDTNATANERSFRISTADGAFKIRVMNDDFSGGRDIITINQDGSSTDYISFRTGAELERLRINSVGNIGIGETSPTASLHIKAGTATAGTAPLKFTSGTNLTTPEAGAIEYDGTHLYFTATNGGTRYQLDQQAGGVNWDAIGDPSGNGAIAMGSTVQTMDWGTATTQNALSMTGGALTTGNLLSLTSNTLSSGALLNITSNGTGALTNQRGLNIALSGTNGTSGQTTYGAYISNTHAGTTSTNVGLYATATGGTTANYAAQLNGDLSFTIGANRTISVLSGTTQADLNLTVKAGDASNFSSSGGNIYIKGGIGGVPGGNGGNVYINSGTGGENGNIYLGDTTGSVNIGSILYFGSTDTYLHRPAPNTLALGSGDSFNIASGTMSLTSANTTQTTTSSAFRGNFNSLTTGTGMYLASSSLTSGTLLDIVSAGTGALTNQRGLNIALSGTNGTSGQTTYGAYISNTHAGTTSTNVGLYASATGGTTANYAAQLNGDLSFTIGANRTISVLSGTTQADLNLTVQAGDNDNSLEGGHLYLKGGSSSGMGSSGGDVYINGGSGGTGGMSPGSIFLGTGGVPNSFVYIGNSDVALYRSAANVLGLQSGDSFNLVSGSLQVAGTEVVTSGRIIRGADGAVGTPAFTFSADPDNGMWRPTTNEIAFSTAGAERLRIDAAGDVGIGQTTPTAALHIKAGTATAGTAPLKLTSGTNLTTTEAGAIEYDGTHLYFTATNGGTRYQLDQQGGGGGNWDTIGDPSGNGAIAMGSTVQTMDWGTATTQNALTMTGGALTTGNLLSLTSNTLSSGALLNITSAGTGALTNQRGLNIALSGTNSTSAQTTYGAYISNTHAGAISTNVGLYATATGGTSENYAAIFENGNVGIGTINPDVKLYVSGLGAVSKFESTNSSRGGIYIGNGEAYSEDETGIYDIGGDYPLLVYDAENDYLHYGPIIINATNDNVGISLSSPTAQLHLPAGVATANNAPLKFTSGTNLTTPEAGAMEWDGTNLFVTQTTGPTRQTVAYTSDLTSDYVPYSGATSDLYFDTHEIFAGSISLNDGTGNAIINSAAMGVLIGYNDTTSLTNIAEGAINIYNNTSIGIGTAITSPTAHLHIAAGTATAGTAPLKFTSGALNTTAEAGAMEFLTNNYYGTDSSAVRRNFIQNGLGFSGGQALIGGTGTTDVLTLQGTSGNGTATEIAILGLVGNSGGTTAFNIRNNGRIGIGGSGAPTQALDLLGNNIQMGAGRIMFGGYTDRYLADFYGFSLVGNTTRPIQIRSTSLLVGINAAGADYGEGNIHMIGNIYQKGTSTGRLILANANTSATDYTATFPAATGTVAYLESPIFTTNITTPLILGGTSTTQDLTFQTTSGVGATGADMHFLVGNNGATEAMTILNNGDVGVGTNNPGQRLDVNGNASINGIFIGKATGSGAQNIALGNSNLQLNTTGANNIGIGSTALQANTEGAENIAIGLASLNFNETGSGNIAIGSNSLATDDQSDNIGIGYQLGLYSVGGDQNVLIGNYVAGSTSGSISNSVIIGFSAGYNAAGANNIFLGPDSGTYETGSNKLIIDNLLRSSEANGRSQALIYGISHATPANQILSLGGGGKVGIGTISPAQELDVTGNTAISGQTMLGLTSVSTSAKLSLSNTISTNGSSTAIAGVHGDYTFNNGGTAGYVQVGNRFVFNNAPTTNSNTMVGEIIRTVDNTTLANLVRGIDITSNAGSNTAGTNTGLRASGATFGLQGVTTALAGGVAVPAAIYGQSTGTTQGDILRLYSNTVTSANSFSTYYHDTSTFTGTGLLMDFATGSGTFSGNFADFQRNNVSQFRITNTGVVSMGLGSTAATSAVCSSLANGTAPTSGVAYEIRDCSNTPVADYAEMYPVDENIEYGDIVMIGSEMVNTYDVGSSGEIDWGKVKGQVTKLVKSNEPHQKNVVGIVSNNYSDFSSTGYNIKNEDNPMPVALSGRVPVKISTQSENLSAGDYITTSNDNGKATKAVKSGFVIGKALEDWNKNSGKEMVMIFIEPGFYNGMSAREFFGLDIVSDQGAEDNLLAKQILEKLISEKEENNGTNLSEIFTDRLIGGVEIITPDMTTNNILVENVATFNGLVYFNASLDFAKSVTFNDTVEFILPPLFNKDTAGFAVIKKDAKEVRIDFDSPYLATPVVNISVTFEKNKDEDDEIFTVEDYFDEKIESVVYDKDETGFSIILNKNAPEDISFSWVALAVRDPQIFESVIDGLKIEDVYEEELEEISNTDNTNNTGNTGNTDNIEDNTDDIILEENDNTDIETEEILEENEVENTSDTSETTDTTEVNEVLEVAGDAESVNI